MLSELEKTVLKKVAENHLVSKADLMRHVQFNGMHAGDNASSVVDIITRRLAEKKFISAVNPVGTTSYAITQRGEQLLRELNGA